MAVGPGQSKIVQTNRNWNANILDQLIRKRTVPNCTIQKYIQNGYII